MKKILLMLALAIATNFTYAQAVLGTMNCSDNEECLTCKDVEFRTDGTVRGVWKYNGCMIFGDDETKLSPSNFIFDPTQNFSSNDYDGVKGDGFTGIANFNDMYQAGHVFIEDGMDIRSSVYDYKRNESGDDYYVNGWYSYIKMISGDDDNALLIQGSVHQTSPLHGSKDVRLQKEGGKVVIGAPTLDLYNRLQMDGSAYTTGLAQPLRITDATDNITPADYTIFANPASGTITLTLPYDDGSQITGVSIGRIYVIKQISAGTVNLEVADKSTNSLAKVDGLATYTFSSPSCIMIQFDGNAYHVISSH